MLILGGFFIATVILNQKKFMRLQNEKLRESERLQEVLRQRPKQIIAAQEEERKRVARDLHDSISQMLAYLKYRLHTVKTQLSQNDSAIQAIASIEDVSGDLEKTLEEVKRISHNLRPKIFDELGFEAAIHGLTNELTQRTSIAVEYECPGNHHPNLPQEIELGLFRIVQEALTNIEKHSKASRVVITSARNSSSYRISISDNGKGFASKEVNGLKEKKTGSRQPEGIGLISMKERAALLGGECNIVSSEQHGTTITIDIPYQSPRN